MMFGKMGFLFATRFSKYDEHMMSEIEDSREFYAYTASLLPMEHGASGTGFELETYYP